MQAVDGAVAERLGIVLDPARFSDSKLALTDEVRARIDAALADDAPDGAPDDTEEGPDQRRARRHHAIRAAMQLWKDRHMVAAAHLAAALPTHPRLLGMQAMALARLRADPTDLQAAIRAAEAVENPPDWLTGQLLQIRNKYRLGAGAADHARFMDHVPDTLAEALEALWQAPARVSDEMVRALVEMRGTAPDEVEAFRRRLNWGTAVKEYLTFLSNYSATAPRDDSAEDAGIRRLAGEVDGLFVPPDLGAIQAQAAAGRSVMLTKVHAGMNPTHRLIGARLGLPEAVVGGKVKTDLQPGRKLQLGAHGNFQSDFLKLVKHLKKAAYVIRITPDGANGGDMLAHDLLGRQVMLAQGAALVAWHARAAVWFTGVQWRDGRAHVTLRPGPVADPEAIDREGFDAAFYDFYMDCCRQVVLGAPEDMAPGGGFWTHLPKKGRPDGA